MFIIYNQLQDDAIPASKCDLGLVYSDNKVALLKQATGYPVAEITNTPEAVCVIYGEVYNGKAVCANAGYEWLGRLSASLIAPLMHRHFDLLANLNGSFAIALYNKISQKLYIASDRYGSQRLFYGTLNGQMHLSMEIEHFSNYGYQRVVSYDYLLQFLTFGYLVSDITLFEHVRQMPHGSIIEIDKDGYQLHRYWDWRFEEEHTLDNEQEIVKLASETWLNAVSKRLEGKGKVAIPLSGGLDSRAILGAALECKSASDIVTFTGGTPGTFDYDIGRMVAKSVGVLNIPMPHTQPRNYEREYLQRTYDTQGFTEGIGFFYALDWAAISDYSTDVMLGFMGGELAGSHLTSQMIGVPVNDQQSLFEAKQLIFEKHRLLNGVVTQDLLGIQQDAYQAQIIKIMNDTNETNNHQWLPGFCMYWDYSQRQRNFISAAVIVQRAHFNYLLPFLDTAWVDMALKVIPKIQLNQSWYKAFLVFRFRKLFELPTKNLQARPLGGGFFFRNVDRAADSIGKAASLLPVRGAQSVGQAARNVLCHILSRKFRPDPQLCRPNLLSINYADFSLWLRGANVEWAKTFQEALSWAADAEVISKTALKKILNEHQEGDDGLLNALMVSASLGWTMKAFNPQIHFRAK